MSWYGSPPIKNIQKLLLTYPLLDQLLNEPEFLTELKAFNSRLLQYITNHPDIAKQAIEYITIPPKQQDSNQRKYKYPMLSIQMFETQAMCVLNSLFKQTIGSKNTFYIDQLYQMLDQKTVLLICAGYFFRLNHCLLNTKFKEIIEYVYNRPEIFHKLLKHSYNLSIANVIQLFVNLDSSKMDKANEERKNMKVQVINAILYKMDEQKNYQDRETIQNLSYIFIQIVQKYYLIADGKSTLEPILTTKSIGFFMELSLHSNPLISLPMLNLLFSIINYYSFSSYNSEDKSNEQFTKKNMQRLELQPLVSILCIYFDRLLSVAVSSPRITLHVYKIYEFLCHSVSLCSNNIFNTIKRTGFLQVLLQLLFKHENNNILHTLIEKTFYHIFVNEKKFYQTYKQYVFCGMNIINKTVNRIMPQKFQVLKAKGYFGHLMRIIKIYSSIQTTNQNIISKIRDNSELWSKVAKEIIKPYQSICFKDLGSYDITISVPTTQYKVKQTNSVVNRAVVKNDMIDKLADEYSQFIKPNSYGNSTHDSMTENQNLFKVPIQQIGIVEKVIHPEKIKDPQKKKSIEITSRPAQNYNDFIQKKKSEAEEQLKLQRSLSKQKRLNSPGINRGNSPKKVNTWQRQNRQQSNSFRQKSPIPPKKLISQSMILNSNKTQKQETLRSQSLKKLKIKIIDVIPIENRRYRRVDDKDMLLLNLLGISK